MNIINHDKFLLKNPSAICIGKFDGIHIGHRVLVECLKKMKEEAQLEAVMISFYGPKSECIYEDGEKIHMAEKIGLDTFISYPFSKELMNMKAQTFIENVIVNQCSGKVIAVGEDFRFGHNREGDVALLKELAEKYDYQVYVFPKETWNHQIVSSTRIRESIQQGKLEDANRMLGAPFFFLGEVVKGNQIGRSVLNMPTANLLLRECKVLPPKGVYASMVEWNGMRYKGVTNIGNKPTVPGKYLAGVETYLFDFDQDIYGDTIKVELIRFIRPEKKFNDLNQLKENMELDKNTAKQILSHIK